MTAIAVLFVFHCFLLNTEYINSTFFTAGHTLSLKNRTLDFCL